MAETPLNLFFNILPGRDSARQAAMLLKQNIDSWRDLKGKTVIADPWHHLELYIVHLFLTSLPPEAPPSGVGE